MKVGYTLDDKHIRKMLEEWCERRRAKLKSFRLVVETGDPGDPREAGYRREAIEVEAEGSCD